MTSADPSQPEVIRIEDLVSPVLSPAQRAAVDYGSTLEFSMLPEDLLAEATNRTGLSDFGRQDFRPRLEAHVEAVEADTGLTTLGRYIIQRRIVRLLSSRLLFGDLLRRHPEIHDIELEPPVIVVGLPRSGTTHLVNLMAADSRFRSLPYWESIEPFPVRGEGPGADGLDPRWLRCQADYEAQMSLAPMVKAMHHQHPGAIEEEIELLDLEFASFTLEWYGRVPQWRDYYFGIDQDATYGHLRTIIKALTFLRGPRRWVLKSPQHLEQLGPLMRTFPDATFAVTHRDPVSVIQSAVTMLAYGDRVRRTSIEPDQLVGYWTDRVEHLLRACVRDRDVLPADRSIDVFFHEFMDDDVAMVERIHDLAGIGLPARHRAELDVYMAANPRGKHGRVAYDLEGDFGVTKNAVRERFGFYFDRFPVQVEH